MDPILTFSAILTAIIGGVTGAGGQGHRCNAGHSAADQTRDRLVEQTEPQGCSTRPFSNAVEARVGCWKPMPSPAPAMRLRAMWWRFREVRTLCRRGGARVIFEGQADFEHLRKVYLDREEDRHERSLEGIGRACKSSFGYRTAPEQRSREVSSMLSGLRQAALLTNIGAQPALSLARLDALPPGSSAPLQCRNGRRARPNVRPACWLAPPRLTPDGEPVSARTTRQSAMKRRWPINQRSASDTPAPAHS